MLVEVLAEVSAIQKARVIVCRVMGVLLEKPLKC